MFYLLNAYDYLIVNYPLVQLKGCIKPYCGCRSIIVSVSLLKNCHYDGNWSTCGPLFKLFVPLRRGENSVRLKCVHYTVSFRVIFAKTDDNLFYIRPIFVICADENGEFQTPNSIDSGKESACKRIGLAIHLLQTLTAEAFLSEYGERFTFQCWNSNEVASNICECHYSQMKRSDLVNCSPETAWEKIASELHSCYKETFYSTKWIAFTACTRFTSVPLTDSYDDMLRSCEAYFALATGGLALLGTATLHSWPEDLCDLQKALLDTRKVSDYAMMNDTAYRDTFWAAFATGLGSVWHEMGHCFGLQHTTDGIMQRGGDDIHLTIAFPPPDTRCVNGCRLPAAYQSAWILGRLQPDTIDALQEADRRKGLQNESNLPMAIQFSNYTCLPFEPSIQIPAGANSCWSYCCSLSHHGGAFWGLEQLNCLLRCKWILPASLTPKSHITNDRENTQNFSEFLCLINNS